MRGPVLLGVALAGSAGASCRYLLDRWVARRTRGRVPWGILVVNVSGSLLLGVVVGAALYRGFSDTPRVILGTGFCGAYTTFSTFSFDTVRLLEEGAGAEAFANVALSLVAGLAAAGAGLAVAARW